MSRFDLKNKEDGFTLIELVVSLFILTVILQVFTFISMSINSASVLRDNLIAVNLAQEGIEVARNIRDRDWFLGNSFGTSLPNGSGRVQWNSTSILSLGGNPPLKKDSSTGVFSYDLGVDTVFKRTITVSLISANEIQITSTVNWDIKSNSKSISAEAHLFNWFNP